MPTEHEQQSDEQKRLAEAPETPRSPRSERQGAPDEGAMEPGKAEPHEDEEEVKRGVKWSADADAQNDGKGEFAHQDEALGRGQLGFPADDPRK